MLILPLNKLFDTLIEVEVNLYKTDISENIS